MINKYMIAAIISIALVVILYIYNFYFSLQYSISNDTAVWGQLGDYTGGLLNPILSFISLVLLIKSLRLQNEANLSLRNDLKNSEKTEKSRIFETQFFNMLEAQKTSFDLFKVSVEQDGNRVNKFGVEAVIEIEEEIEKIRQEDDDDEKIKDFLSAIDSNDQLFGVTRRFYIMVKIISEKLTDENDFSDTERTSQLMTLINFSDFPLLRLVMMSMQFMDYKSTEYLKENDEFNSVLQEVGIGWNLY